MPLYILTPVGTLPEENDPWKPWYDKAFGFVIRASSEAEARALADKSGGDETDLHDSYDGKLNQKHPWLSYKHSRCIELKASGKPQIILRDFTSA